MLIENPMKTYHKKEIADAVIVGTGAGGAPLLSRLAKSGLKVVALEAGNHWTPEQDFATDEYSQSKLFWNDERLSAGKDALAFGSNNSGIGVGGSTLHYTAYVPRPHPDDFHLYSDFGVGENWPISFQDLEAYYEEVENFIGVSGPAEYPWGASRKNKYPFSPLPLNGAAQLMQRGCESMGIPTSAAPNAAISAPYYQEGYGMRPACTNRGYCQAGCSNGAKSSMDVTFIPLAIKYGAEIRTQSFVTGFEKDLSGKITAVIYQTNGEEHRQLCKNVFLCAGAIETPRLLLINDLANSSGQVGKNFMTHTGMQVWGQFEEDIRPYKGIPGSLISEHFHRPKEADFAGGFLLQSIGVMPVTFATQVARGRKIWGPALKECISQYNNTAGINILGECLPHPENFVELSNEKDKRGLPKPRIHFTNGSNEKKLTEYAEILMKAIWTNAGGKDIWSFNRNPHLSGTCRMGDDPGRSVVDKNGRSHDISNLFIADNSVFPSSLSANPALTIMALSLRTADKFLDHHKI